MSHTPFPVEFSHLLTCCFHQHDPGGTKFPKCWWLLANLLALKLQISNSFSRWDTLLQTNLATKNIQYGLGLDSLLLQMEKIKLSLTNIALFFKHDFLFDNVASVDRRVERVFHVCKFRYWFPYISIYICIYNYIYTRFVAFQASSVEWKLCHCSAPIPWLFWPNLSDFQAGKCFACKWHGWNEPMSVLKIWRMYTCMCVMYENMLKDDAIWRSSMIISYFPGALKSSSSCNWYLHLSCNFVF